MRRTRKNTLSQKENTAQDFADNFECILIKKRNNKTSLSILTRTQTHAQTDRGRVRERWMAQFFPERLIGGIPNALFLLTEDTFCAANSDGKSQENKKAERLDSLRALLKPAVYPATLQAQVPVSRLDERERERNKKRAR